MLVLALTGCMFTPSATTKVVTTNDVIGLWSFTEDYGKTTVYIKFVPTGVFTQKVVSALSTNSSTGRWILNGPNLELTNFLAQVDGGWKPYTMGWYFIDGDKRRLEIFGGAFPDPDSFQHLKFLGPPDRPLP